MPLSAHGHADQRWIRHVIVLWMQDGGMPTGDGQQWTDRTTVCAEVVGLPEPVACERIEERGLRFRVAAVGDTPTALHADRKPDRVDLWLSEDRVVVRAEPS
jgi:hypothetical protein